MFSIGAIAEKTFSELIPQGFDTIGTRYFSSNGFVSEPTDTPANQSYEPGIVQPLTFLQRIPGAYAGLVQSRGDALINNVDGRLDFLLQGIAVDGRDVRVYMGRPGWRRDQFEQVFAGTIDKWDGTIDRMKIFLRDGAHRLSRRIQENFYLGTGGTEGGDDLKDKPKPLGFGKIYNAPAVEVDTANKIYQVHDGEVCDIDAVYDRGVKLDKIAGATFDGSNDYMTRGGSLTGSADSKVGTIACRIRLNGGDASTMSLIHNTGGALHFRRLSDNTFTIKAENSGGTTILNNPTASTYTSGSTWLNILISWDLGNDTVALMYINDSDDADTATTFTDDTIDYTVSNWAVGETLGATDLLNADIDFLWCDFTQKIDFSVEANRRLFFDATGERVDLGCNGETPTGTSPIIYLNRSYDDFEDNQGTGGDFTVTGTLTQPTIAAGEWYPDKTNGMFILGGDSTGTITCNFQGSITRVDANGPDGYIDSTSKIIERIVRDFADIGTANLDIPSFEDLEAAEPATVGIWIRDPRQVADVVSELIIGISGFAVFNRDDKMQVGQFDLPLGTEVVEFTDIEIIDIEQEATPREINPPVWRRQVGWRKNYEVQTDIAGSVSSSHRAFISSEYRVAVSSNDAIKTKHILANDPPLIRALYADEVDAQAEAARLFVIYRETRYIYNVRIKTCAYDLKLNDIVKLTYNRWNLSGGLLTRIVGINIDAAQNITTLKVFA